MRLKDLEILLSQTKSFENPKIKLEQYQTPSHIAAMVVWRAFELGDIKDKVVADFCCGTGIFAIAAYLLNAKEVYGYDIDPEALLIAKENAKKMDAKIRWVLKDVRKIEKNFDTILMNAPFGIKSPVRDREFLKVAMLHSKVAYSIHFYRKENLDFLQKFVEKHGKKIKETNLAQFHIPHVYPFHAKEKHVTEVVILRIE